MAPRPTMTPAAPVAGSASASAAAAAVDDHGKARGSDGPLQEIVIDRWRAGRAKRPWTASRRPGVLHRVDDVEDGDLAGAGRCAS